MIIFINRFNKHCQCSYFFDSLCQVMIEVKGNTQPIKVTRNFPCRAKYEQKLIILQQIKSSNAKTQKNDHFLLLCSSLWLTMGCQLHYIKQLQGIKRTTHPLKQNEIKRKVAKQGAQNEHQNDHFCSKSAPYWSFHAFFCYFTQSSLKYSY